MRRSLLLIALLLVTGCMAERPAVADTATTIIQPTLQPDACDATALQGFIGKPKEQLPVNLPRGARVLCDTCAATMDYNPGRLNVIFGTTDGIVKQVRCG